MRSGLKPYTFLRVLVFIGGCLLIGAAVMHLGFPASHVVIITAATGLLCIFTLELPWGGFLAPSDSSILAVCLLTGGLGAVPLGIAAAIAAALLVGELISHWAVLSAGPPASRTAVFRMATYTPDEGWLVRDT